MIIVERVTEDVVHHVFCIHSLYEARCFFRLLNFKDTEHTREAILDYIAKEILLQANSAIGDGSNCVIIKADDAG